jgi:branched-chain amino acid transport system substrate-binding protein
MNNRSLIFFASVLAFGLAGTLARAEDGVTQDRILFGQVAALEGPAQALGRGMREGLLAAFAEANRAGGIAGRQLELKSADDSYEPEKMIEAMKKMLGEDKVFAIVGPVGTPTANAGQPIATEAKVPFIGALRARSSCAIRINGTSSIFALPISRRPRPGSSI